MSVSIHTFPIDEILTVTTGRLVAHRGMDAVYEILNFLTGENLYTHQLVRAAPICAKFILQVYPELAKISTTDLDELLKKYSDPKQAVNEWVEEIRKENRDSYELMPLPVGMYQAMNPISEAILLKSENEGV
jgi:hypothetical protein